MKTPLLLPALALCLAAAAPLPGQEKGADVLKLDNGDRVSGELLSIGKGKVTFRTGFAPKLEIPLDRVAWLETVDPVDLVFADGRRKKGRLRLGADPGGEVAPGTFSFASLEAAGLEAVNPPPPPIYRWEGSLNVGYTAARGNTRSDIATIQGTATRRWEKTRLGLDGIWLYQRTYDEGRGDWDLEQRALRLSAKYDYFISKKVYAFATGRGETDEQARLDLRYRVGAGAGYQFYEEEDLKLSGEVGMAYDKREFEGGSEEEDGMVRLAENLEVGLGKGFTFLHGGELLTTTTGAREHTADFFFTLRGTLTESFFAQFQARYQWETDPAPGADRLDEQYIFSLGWKF